MRISLFFSLQKFPLKNLTNVKKNIILIRSDTYLQKVMKFVMQLCEAFDEVEK